jgi:general secretion pathway protein D
MKHWLLIFALTYSLALLSGCATVPSQRVVGSSDDFTEVQVEDIFPKNSVAGLPDQAIRKGIKAFGEKDYVTASSQFNQALRYDPRNSYLQFLNGLSYHMRAEAGEATQYEPAKLGYELALKFDKSNHLAAQQLARYYLKKQNYKQAQEYFAHSLLYQPGNPELLYGLAKSSYYQGDLETAYSAIWRAKELGPKNPGIVSGHAVISAALGEFDSAGSMLAEFRTIEPASPRVKRVEERIREWQDLYKSQQNVQVAAADSSSVPLPLDIKTEEKPDQQSPVPDQKMAVIDVTMIRTEEDESTNRGVNLLNGLKLQFGGEASVSSTASTGSPDNFSKNVTGKITIPQLEYNLNIFNTSSNRNEILARPTIIALDGKESKFFAGSTLNVAVQGNDSPGSIEKVDTGITLQVTPVFLASGAIQLSLMVSRSSFEEEAGGSFKESIKVSKNEVTANVIMKFGQTLVLSGLREKETVEGRTGVPILMDIPLVQYLFSNKKTSDIHKSILIFLTPRRVLPGVNVSDDADAAESELKSLKEFRERYRYLFKSGDNLSHIMRHAEQHKVVQEIRTSDLFDTVWWGTSDSLSFMINRAVSFMYY